jgi:hypothetical protein
MAALPLTALYTRHLPSPGIPHSLETSENGRSGDAERRWFERNFPTIAESGARRFKSTRVGFLIASEQKKFEKIAGNKSFPFEAVGYHEVKLKAIPISFCWTSNGGLEEEGLSEGMEGSNQKRPLIKGPVRQRPWFRPPPKVRIIP